MPRLPMRIRLATLYGCDLADLTGDERIAAATYTKSHHGGGKRGGGLRGGAGRGGNCQTGLGGLSGDGPSQHSPKVRLVRLGRGGTCAAAVSRASSSGRGAAVLAVSAVLRDGSVAVPGAGWWSGSGRGSKPCGWCGWRHCDGRNEQRVAAPCGGCVTLVGVALQRGGARSLFRGAATTPGKIRLGGRN